MGLLETRIRTFTRLINLHQF